MTDLITALADLIETRYVLPDEGRRIADHLRGINSVEPTGESLSALIRQVSSDGHLRVRPRPLSRPSSEADWRAHYAGRARLTAGGISEVRRLNEATGLLAISPYTAPVDLAEPYVRAAFTLLADVDQVVIDLRSGRGGTPETIALICGYLLGDESVHLQDIVDRSGQARQYWTQPAAGRLPSSTQVAVLTSPGTFSGCEELAYDLQALKRAVVVGERTGGGAHPVEAIVLSEEWEVSMPIARSVNTMTGTNWEQVGVRPDVACLETVALDLALDLLKGSPP